MSIDRSLFQEKKADSEQEWTRQIILEAFDEVDKHPEKYAKPFKFMIPEKPWRSYTIGELKKLAKKLGDHIANWVEWALVLAQRISNGETWKAVCNERDTGECYRLIAWKYSYYRIVGCSIPHSYFNPASEFYYLDCEDDIEICNTVPAVVCYKENCPVFYRMAS